MAIPTAPYNGKSKTIENIFSRLQQGFLKQDWFFCGQNVTAKSLESKPNMEYILANKLNLPSEAKIREQYAIRREEWNNAKHPSTGKTRLETYLSSENPGAPRVTILEMVDLFYLTNPTPITFRAGGLQMELGKVKNNYIVANDGIPDQDFIDHNVDKKFIVKYDPSDMSVVFLYEKTKDSLRFITPAETKVTIHRGKQEQDDWEAQFIKTVDLQTKAKRVERVQKTEDLLSQYRASAKDYGHNLPAIKGVQTSKAAKHRDKALVPVVSSSYGQYEKDLSNQDLLDLEDSNFSTSDYLKYNM